MLRAFSRVTIASMRLAGHGRVEPAQHVVGAEFDDHAVGAVGHRPVEPVEPAGGGVAGDARIDDLDTASPSARSACSSTVGKAALGRQVVAGRQAVAERHERDRLAPGPAPAVGASVDDQRQPHTRK